MSNNRTFTLSKIYMEVEGDLYEILKELVEAKPGPPMEMWKEYLGADKIFRKDGMLYFVKQIEEAQIIK